MERRRQAELDALQVRCAHAVPCKTALTGSFQFCIRNWYTFVLGGGAEVNSQRQSKAGRGTRQCSASEAPAEYVFCNSLRRVIESLSRSKVILEGSERVEQRR